MRLSNLTLLEKIKRLEQWCEDVNANQHDTVYIKQEGWKAPGQKSRNFMEAVRAFAK